MFRVKYLVKLFLENNPRLRDCDNSLICEVIREYEGENIKNMSANDLLKSIQDKKYGSFEGIRRSMQKWQEHYEDLRDEKWEDRHAHARNVCEQLKIWDFM